jgi:glycosyltransferase involved in cell wall biosynthesis
MSRDPYRPRTIHVCVISCFPPSIGPLSEYTLALVNGFSSDPAISRITVIADRVKEPETNSNRKIRIERSWKLDSALTILRIISAVLRCKPDVVYFNLVYRHFSPNRLKNFMGLLTPLAIKILGFPVIVTLHSIGEAFDVSKVGYKNSFLNKFGIRLATRAILSVDVLTLTHNHFVELLQEKYNAENVIFIPHGVFGTPIPSCNFKGNQLIMFGKMGPYKNLQLMLDAYKEISLPNHDTEFVVAGSSHPFYPGFLEKIKNEYGMIPNVTYTGYISEEDIAETFMRATIVLLPYTESVWSSGVFILSCIYGRPVLASDLPDFKDLKDQGAGILLFEKGVKQDLLEKMTMLLTDKNMQNRLGELNLEWAKRNKFEKTVTRLVMLFQEILLRR